MDSPGEWHVSGSYYETCNCDAVCPCRRHNGRPGGRSIYGVCQFLLTWHVLEGHAGSIDLSGRRIAMAGFYNDDEKGKPWRVILYIDREASGPAHAALEAIFLGRAAGDLLFTSHIAEVIAVRSAAIDLDHRKGKEVVSIKDFAWAAVERRADYEGTISCGIPGHHHPGEESVSRAKVSDGPLLWSYEGRCGFATSFDHRS
jgi:hypothetical protein